MFKKVGRMSLNSQQWLFNFNHSWTVWLDASLRISDVDTSYSEAPEDIEGQISAVESIFNQRADALDAGVSRLTEGLRTKADISVPAWLLSTSAVSWNSLKTSTQNKLIRSWANWNLRCGLDLSDKKSWERNQKTRIRLWSQQKPGNS